MFEVRIHGRAGQGAKLATQLLAEAALMDGKYAQAFPEYGPERTGAPVIAYCRIDDKEIRAHYPIVKPDVVIVLDPSLLDSEPFDAGAGADTILVINSRLACADLQKKYFWSGDLYSMPATEMALKVLGVNQVNTTLLGFLIRTMKIVKRESLEEVLRRVLGAKNSDLVEKNIAALAAGYQYKTIAACRRS